VEQVEDSDISISIIEIHNLNKGIQLTEIGIGTEMCAATEI